MNEIIEKLTRELGAAIQNDEVYKAYAQAKIRNDGDAELQENIKKLNLIRLQYNSELSKATAERDSEKIDTLSKEFNTIYTSVMQNQNMMLFEGSKKVLNALMERISNILMLCANGEDPETCEPPHSCGGECSSCSGCH